MTDDDGSGSGSGAAGGNGAADGDREAADGAGDGDLPAAVESFLREADRAFEEYDAGYVDADVVVSRLRAGTRDLRSALEEN